jgi:hypothetical protein
MNHVYLQGSEDVKSAGHDMQRAAERMKQAAFDIDAALDRHQKFLDDWLTRFEAALRETEE